MNDARVIDLLEQVDALAAGIREGFLARAKAGEYDREAVRQYGPALDAIAEHDRAGEASAANGRAGELGS